MRIALIHYDVDRVANEPGNKIVMKHFGHMPNIQLLYVAAILEKLEIDLRYYDIIGMSMTNIEIENSLKSFSPDYVGLSVFTSHFHNAISWAKYLKSFLPKTKIILGGVHTQIYPVETLKFNSYVDYACVGEAEMVLPEFFRRARSNESFEGLRGLVWRDNDIIKYAGPPDICRNLNEVPFPARHLIPNHKYYNFISSLHNFTVFNSSRGCPYRCIFCEAAGSRWRARSPENVVAEFEECYEKHGIREIDIFDSSFTVSKRRVLEICRLLIKKGLNKRIIWDIRSRVDTIDEEMLEALKEAGCYRIYYGIESANAAILKTLRKEIDIEKIEKIVRKTDQLGISAFGYFLIGAPGETYDTMRETIDFAKKLPLDFAIFNRLTAFPKTELYDRFYLPAVARDFWAEYLTESEQDTSVIERPWTYISGEELKRIAHRAMNEYYFRPQQIYRALRSVRSIDQIKRYIWAGCDMLMSYLAKK